MGVPQGREEGLGRRKGRKRWAWVAPWKRRAVRRNLISKGVVTPIVGGAWDQNGASLPSIYNNTQWYISHHMQANTIQLTPIEKQTKSWLWSIRWFQDVNILIIAHFNYQYYVTKAKGGKIVCVCNQFFWKAWVSSDSYWHSLHSP